MLPYSILSRMEKDSPSKRQHLEDAGLLHPRPEQVKAPLFHDYPAFFDAHDQLQVRYEMLRAHLVDKQNVVAICQRYGVSRQTFYNLQARFVGEGTAGLLLKKPGPKGPSKLTTEVVAFVAQQLQQQPQPSTRTLVASIEQRFGVSFHKRTLEKLVTELRSKKNA